MLVCVDGGNTTLNASESASALAPLACAALGGECVDNSNVTATLRLCVCADDAFMGQSRWGGSSEGPCYINVNLAKVMYSSAFVFASAIVVWVLRIAVERSKRPHSARGDSTQNAVTNAFLLHTLCCSLCQAALMGLSAFGEVTLASSPQLIIFQILIAYFVMGGTLYACAMWMFILPKPILMKKKSLMKFVRQYLKNVNKYNAVFFVLFTSSYLPQIITVDDPTKLSIQMLMAVITITVVPVILIVPLCSIVLYSVMYSATPKTGSLSILMALYRKGAAALNDSASTGMRFVIFKLQASVGLTLFLGGGAIGYACLTAFIPFIYARPYVFYVGLNWIASAWSGFILLIFCRKSKKKKIGGSFKTTKGATGKEQPKSLLEEIAKGIQSHIDDNGTEPSTELAEA